MTGTFRVSNKANSYFVIKHLWLSVMDLRDCACYGTIKLKIFVGVMKSMKYAKVKLY